MPLNYTELESRLNKCHQQLSDLFNNESISETLQDHIKAVKEYYKSSYEQAQKDKTSKDIIASYELYVEQLSQVKSGTLLREKMLDTINYANDSRKISVFLANLAKAAELIFWAATAVTLYAATFLIALPMLIVQTPLGIAASITIGGLLLATAIKCCKCLTEFKSFGRHDDEYVHEVSLLSYFKPTPKEPTTSEETTEEMSYCC